MSTNDRIIETATREAALRSQNTLLTNQYSAIHSTLVKYAEAMGRLCGVAKPLVAEYRELVEDGYLGPGSGRTYSGLYKHLEAFAKEMDQLIRKEPKDGAQEQVGTDVAKKDGQAQEGAPDRGSEGAARAVGEEATPKAQAPVRRLQALKDWWAARQEWKRRQRKYRKIREEGPRLP